MKVVPCRCSVKFRNENDLPFFSHIYLCACLGSQGEVDFSLEVVLQSFLTAVLKKHFPVLFIIPV